jgi:hypothetical protein
LNHEEHEGHEEKAGRLASSPHPTAEFYAPDKVLFLFVLLFFVLFVLFVVD